MSFDGKKFMLEMFKYLAAVVLIGGISLYSYRMGNYNGHVGLCEEIGGKYVQYATEKETGLTCINLEAWKEDDAVIRNKYAEYKGAYNINIGFNTT